MSVEVLVKNHQRFKKEYGDKYSSLFKELVEKGQSPKTLFVTCSDSRIAPNLITLTEPGDLFVARNIGNIVPPFDPESEASATPAAVEYAVSVLKVENIVICGHTECGACKSLHQDIPDIPEMTNVRKWLRFGAPAKEQALALVPDKEPKALYAATEKFNIIQQLENLLTYPAIKKRVEDGELFLHGWYYQLIDGDIEYFDPTKNEFLPIDDMA
jgi:carbonic anhydrase